jgi:hypothetical protein
MKHLLLTVASVLLIIGTMGTAHDDEPAPSQMRMVQFSLPLLLEEPAPVVVPRPAEPKGRWVEVCATAYTPTNAVDSEYHATKGAYRWKTADGRTDVRKKPYGIAVPLQRRKDGKKIPVWKFGTQVIIPTGNGYLDRSRPEERVFSVDDTSDSDLFFYSKQGKLHIDVRFVDEADALKWAGPRGYRFLKIFILE